MTLTSTRNAKGAYLVKIAGEEIYIEHGINGWYAGCYDNVNEELTDEIDSIGQEFETKRELYQMLTVIKNRIES